MGLKICVFINRTPDVKDCFVLKLRFPKHVKKEAQTCPLYKPHVLVKCFCFWDPDFFSKRFRMVFACMMEGNSVAPHRKFRKQKTVEHVVVYMCFFTPYWGKISFQFDD